MLALLDKNIFFEDFRENYLHISEKSCNFAETNVQVHITHTLAHEKECKKNKVNYENKMDIRRKCGCIETDACCSIGVGGANAFPSH